MGSAGDLKASSALNMALLFLMIYPGDNIFTNFANPAQINTSYILATKLSDHLPCILSFEIESKPPKKPNRISSVMVEGYIYWLIQMEVSTGA